MIIFYAYLFLSFYLLSYIFLFFISYHRGVSMVYRVLYVNKNGNRHSTFFEDPEQFIPLSSVDMVSFIKYFFMLANPDCRIIEVSSINSEKEI